MSQVLSRGATLGAGAGAALALSDFGALWLWLQPENQPWLLLALLAIQLPLGALLGALLALVAAGSDPWLERLSRRTGGRLDALRAVALTALLAPGLGWIGLLLFTGGSMSRIAHKELLQALATAALLSAGAVGSYVALRGARAIRERPRWALPAAFALALAGVAASKVDQWLFPKLYGYLHAALTVASWLLFAAALWAFARTWQRDPLTRAAPFAVVAALMGLLCTMPLLASNHNVQVALLDARASHSRSLMLGLQPLVAGATQQQRLREAAALARRARRQRPEPTRTRTERLPEHADAHVLLITVDALRADHLGTYGYARPTSPRMDALAAESVVFERAYVPAPHSSYSLCSLLTSEHLHETVDLRHDLPEHTLAQALEHAGYHTAAFYTDGIFHTAGDHLQAYRDNAFGFALYDHHSRSAEAMTDRALEEVDRIVQQGERNSFLWVHYFDVHEPYRATTFGTGDEERYDSEILRVDAAVDRLVRETRHRLGRDVIVVLTADHGEEFREHGGLYHGSTLYDEQIRVPLIVNAPGLSPRRVAQPVETVDVAPTIMSLLGLPVSESMRGKDLRALATGQTDQRGPVFSAVSHKHAVIAWPYKLIADLRFGLYELYHLERDPAERHNLANDEPLVRDNLRGELYAWLDALSTDRSEPKHPHYVALDRGRLGDRRAVGPLCELATDGGAPEQARVEALRLLGHLRDERAKDALLAAMRSDEPVIAAEGAIALGRLYDKRARTSLLRLVRSEDPDIRTRAAVSLARLRDRAAVPGLIEALWFAREKYDRKEAVRWLGRLRDPRALDPLIALLPELRTRYLVVIALGQIGDPRAYDALVDVLSWEHHANIRDNVVRGLGLLGEPRALDVLVPLAVAEPTFKNTSESLVRLGALQRREIGGADARPARTGRGFGRCHAGPLLHDWNYRHRTYCETEGPVAALKVNVPEAVVQAAGGAVAVLGAKRLDGAEPVELTVRLGDSTVHALQLDQSWTESRWSIPPGVLTRGKLRARLHIAYPDARLAIDHLLLLPRQQPLQAAGQGG